MWLTFLPPCTLAREAGAAEAPGIHQSCSEAGGQKGCLLQACGRKE